jgi:hypothetical protein
MTDLSHWDFAHYFTGPDAAALILGIDAGNVSDAQKHKIQPVEKAILSCFLPALHHPDSARDALSCEDYGLWIFSVQLKHVLAIDKTNTAHKNLKAMGGLNFEVQSFDRQEISRWLEAHGRQSIYPFINKQSPDLSATAAVNRWPWGKHHTKLLGHLEAAARRFWGDNYVSSDATTASTNATVSEWLQTERKVSKTMADSIASMLRPDGLPTGPRK